MSEMQTHLALLQESQRQRDRLDELEETLRAIRSGDVDALIMTRPEGEQVFTLHDALEPYRIMVEVMRDGAVKMTEQGVILYCNSSFAQLVSMPLEQVVGQPLLRWIADEHAATFRRMLALGSSQPIHEQVMVRAEDGRLVAVSLSMNPLPHSSGRGIASVLTDLTELVAVAEARLRLHESEEKFRYMFDHSPIGNSITSLTGELHVNRAFCDMLGYTEAELERARWQDLTLPEDIELSEKALLPLRAGQCAAVQFRKRYRHKNGREVWVEVSTALRRDVAGAPLYFMSHIVDITERKHAEEQIRTLNAELELRVAERTASLEAANKELEAFSYSISHDLRAPLRAIDGFSRKLVERDGDKLDAEGRRLLQVVRDNAQRMGQLIDDLLSFSRMGRMEISAGVLNMDAMVRGVIDELCVAEPQLNGAFVLAPLPAAIGDGAMLQQVWFNLLANAVKFTRHRQVPRIEVGGRRQDHELIYWVKDNGAGFDMRYVDKLFGVFQRLHRQDEFEGTGVGLAIVQRILLRHGGRIAGEGQADVGATFTFALPWTGEPAEEGRPYEPGYAGHANPAGRG